MGRYQHYPDYKHSRFEWLGDIPDHWNIKKLKFIASIQPSNVDKKSKEDEQEVNLCNYTDVYYNENINASMAFMKATATKEQIKRFTLQAGDTIITKDSEDPSDIAVPSYVPEDLPGVICGYHLAIIRPKNPDFGKYIKRVFETGYARSYFSTRANGLTRYGLGAYPLSNISFPIPPKDEAQTIAAFLDHETAKIDWLIAKQKRLIELLKEKRQVVISNAVSSSDTSELVKLGYFVDLLPGYAFPSASFSHDDSDMPLLRGINVGVDSIRWDETVYWPKDSCIQLRNFSLKSGDLVFGMDRPWISGGVRVAEISHADVPALLLQRVCRLRARRGLTQKFLKLILSSQEFKDYVEADLTGVSVPHISPDQIGSFRLRLPSEEQQRSVCESADEQFQKIRATISKAKEAICLMKEHRTTLISAAVTGKIDVRGWQMTSTQPQEAATAANA